MPYTKAQLETQLSLAEMDLAFARTLRKAIDDPNYPPAKKYGEDVRENHKRKTEKDIAHYLKRIENLSRHIASMTQ